MQEEHLGKTSVRKMEQAPEEAGVVQTPKASLTLCGCCRPQSGPLSESLTEQKCFASWTWKLHFREPDAAGLAGSFGGLSPWLTDSHLLPGSSRGLRSVWLKS